MTGGFKAHAIFTVSLFILSGAAHAFSLEDDAFEFNLANLQHVARAGDIGQLAVPLTAGFIAGNDDKARSRLVTSLVTTGVVTHALKNTINETRPNGGDNSFPSGHTSLAFTGAAFIQQNYGWGYGIPAYLTAAFVGWSRVQVQAHWKHDVAAGALLGIGSSYLTLVDTGNLEIQPALNLDFASLNVLYKW